MVKSTKKCISWSITFQTDDRKRSRRTTVLRGNQKNCFIVQEMRLDERWILSSIETCWPDMIWILLTSVNNSKLNRFCSLPAKHYYFVCNYNQVTRMKLYNQLMHCFGWLKTHKVFLQRKISLLLLGFL